MLRYIQRVAIRFGKLLTPAISNPKTAKLGEAFEAAILHLSPANIAHRNTVCPNSTYGCRACCLNTSGRSQISGGLTVRNLNRSTIHRARIAKTRLYWNHRRVFLELLFKECAALQKKANRLGKKAVIRLNGTSDIPWETISPDLFAAFPETQFYDYTKGIDRALASVETSWPSNYHLTYSRTELDAWQTVRALAADVNVAVVFAGLLPSDYLGYDVIDGTAHDWRFTDPRGVVVGLLAKGRAKSDQSGFVVDPFESAPPIECTGCADRMGPSHNGSKLCRNAAKALAAGGTVAHCTCSACF